MKRLPYILLLVALVIWYVFFYQVGTDGLQPLSIGHGSQGPAPLVASGVVSIDETKLALTRGGRIASVWVTEGDSVQAGQRLLALDSTLHQGAISVAEAQVAVAQAALANAEAGSRPGQVAIAQVALERARAIQEVARQALRDLERMRDNPQERDMQIAVAEARLVVYGHRLDQAIASKDAAEASKGLYEYLQDLALRLPPYAPVPGIPASLQAAPYEWWKAWINVNAIQDSIEGERAALELLREARDQPLELDGQISQAEAAVLKADSGVDAAAAQLRAFEAGASDEQLAALAAQVDQARVALNALLAQSAELELRAPREGVILSLPVSEGQVLVPGTTAIVLGDPSSPEVTVFVPEVALGRVKQNQLVQVAVDAWPDLVSRGEVRRIADRAEYTPRNVATQEGRSLTYYAVDIAVDNSSGWLKPGMPADVLFIE